MKRKVVSLILLLAFILTLMPCFEINSEAVANFNPILPVDSNKVIVLGLDTYSGGSSHNGIDLTPLNSADKYQDIYAIADGVVYAARNSCTHESYNANHACPDTWGNYISIKHTVNGETYFSVYAHLKYDSIKVSAGNSVSAGQVIAQMGTSGGSTGHHLHLEIWKGEWSDKNTYNPYSFDYYQNNPSAISGLTFAAGLGSNSPRYKNWITTYCDYTNGNYVYTYYNANTVVRIAQQYADDGATNWNNLCLGFVNACFNRAYGYTPINSHSCCAYNYGTHYLDSSSRDSIPIGASVFFGGSDIVCSGCGNNAGHIGIYVGDGYIIHSWSGKVQKSSIDYVINCGYPYRGYGWHGNLPLSEGGGYLSQCTFKKSYCDIEVTTETVMKTLPCDKTTDERTEDIRTFKAGKILTVTGLYRNTVGNWWYLVEYEGETGYVFSGDTELYLLNRGTYISNPIAPEALNIGERFSIGGTVSSDLTELKKVCGRIKQVEETICHEGEEISGGTYNLLNSKIDMGMLFNELEEGWYTYEIYVREDNSYADGTELYTVDQWPAIYTTEFKVGNPPSPNIPVTSVEISALGWTIYNSKDAVYSVDATVYPENATNKSLIWKSSDTSIATVDEHGNIKPVNCGKCFITVLTVDGGFADSIEITVFDENTSFTSGSYTYKINSDMTAAITSVSTAISGDVIVPSRIDGYTVNKIEKNAFWNCDKITSVTIPANVSMSERVFGNCTALEAVIVEEGNQSHKSIEGILYTKDGTELVMYPAAKQGEKFVVPSDVTIIHNSAFQSCRSLKSVVIHKDVTTIGNMAFGNADLTIYAEADSKPEGWSPSWNFFGYPVVWGYAETTGVELDRGGVTFDRVDVTFQLTATVKPANAYDKSVIWTSSNTAVATVDANGKVTAVGNGTCVITATTVDGGFTATCIVTVRTLVDYCSDNYVYLIEKKSVTVETGSMYDELGAVIGEVESSTGKTQNKVKVMLSNGTTIIMQYSEDNGSEKFSNLVCGAVYMHNMNDDGTISFNPYLLGAKNVAYGGFTTQKSAKPTEVVNVLAFDFETEKIGEYKTDEETLVFAEYELSSGKVVYRVIKINEFLSLTDGLELNVVARTIEAEPVVLIATLKLDGVLPGGGSKATGVTLNKTSATLNTAGETLQLTATIAPDNAFDKSVTWTSSNNTVATVDANGLVTAVSNGTATITATTTDGGFTATCTVTVDNKNAPYVDGYYTYTINNGKATITDVDTAISGDVVIPSTLGGHSVVGIGSYAFEYCTGLTSITIPNSVTNIASWTFADCSNLTSVTIGNSVTSIGSYAFYCCSSLPSITIPDSVTSIGSWAFADCSGLTIYAEAASQPSGWYSSWNPDSRPVVWGYVDGAVYIEGNYTYQVNNTKATITSVDTSISGDVTIPSTLGGCTVIGIGSYAFYKCDSLTNVTIPNNVTDIGKSAFMYCSSLTSVTIPDSVTSIGQYAFAYCSSLTSVTIGNGVTTIGELAFRDCDSLTEMTIPAGVTNIGKAPFYDCTNLTDITTDKNNRSYKSVEGVLYTKDGKTLIQYPAGKTYTNFVIPDSVTGINDCAFVCCINLTSITIPDGVTDIGSAAFDNCSSLTSVIIPDSVTSIGHYAFYSCSSLINVTIPNGVTDIKSSTFQNCSSLTSITIPDGVTDIGSAAFDNCSSLTSVIIPDSVTSIGRSAFRNCSLTDVTIPDSVTSIVDFAFENCSSLTSVTIPNSVTSIGYYAFYGCSSLTIYAEAESQPGGWVEDWNYSNRPVVWGYGKVTGVSLDKASATLTAVGETLQITATVTPDHAYDKSVTWTSSNSSVATVDQTGLVTAVENGNCIITATTTDGGFTATCSVKVDDVNAEYTEGYYTYTVKNGKATITTVDTAISGDITIPSTLGGYPVVAIGDSAFYIDDGGFVNPYNIESVVIPEGVTSIGNKAFSNCRYLRSVTLPQSLTSIGRSAFWNSALTSINIPAATTKIGDNALHTCYSLASITVTEGNTAYKSVDGVLYTKDGKTLVVYPARKADKSFIIPDSVTTIGGYAFSGCRSLTSVIIPDSVTSIGHYAFYSCSSLNIYAEAASRPTGWNANWNYTNCPVVWEYVATDGVSLDKTRATLTSVGATVQLTATVAPADAYDKSVTWTSSNIAVSTVDASGLVTAVSNGTATITATTTDGGFTATCEVTVNIPEPEPEEPDTPIEPEQPEIDPTAPTITVSDVRSLAGETVEVTVSISNNPGFAGMAYDIVYDNTVLELVSYDLGLGSAICVDSGVGTYADKINLQYAAAKNVEGDGVLVTLTFKVKEDATEGTTEIRIVPEEGTFFYYEGREEKDFSVQCVFGGVEIVDYIKGDINGDGIVNNRDSARLLQYLAGWDVEYVEAAMDVNGDGVINNRDAARILQYLAGWDVELH